MKILTALILSTFFQLVVNAGNIKFSCRHYPLGADLNAFYEDGEGNKKFIIKIIKTNSSNCENSASKLNITSMEIEDDGSEFIDLLYCKEHPIGSDRRKVTIGKNGVIVKDVMINKSVGKHWCIVNSIEDNSFTRKRKNPEFKNVTINDLIVSACNFNEDGTQIICPENILDILNIERSAVGKSITSTKKQDDVSSSSTR
ncbi:MAG: hypothetical protein VX341_09280 [Bdellovibrionota bacterium]|nr:hypothetical protein [Bdellovibrionota bacterium]